MFWTDQNQAQERLVQSVVNYDGKPAYIEEIRVADDGSVGCRATLLGKGKRQTISLSDEKWQNFRDLPRLGWFNYIYDKTLTPKFIERKAVNSRVHGLSNHNTACFSINNQGLEKDRYFSLTDYLGNSGYLETAASEEAFPKLSDILMSLDETPRGVAFSPKFMVLVTEEGMKWLVRKKSRIGFFTGTDSLNLFPKLGFYKEELQACPTFDIANVREF